ncbi:RluA family pseudouridine synthase [Marinigracilibium pacificum]|uniref:RluA family pseudouridine synthase n=1 Tax=Marinigracilibium pacificum TaxID=2729599 RepID=A0A848J363_9BACT|nr:RluA family pseudouridine synthase [Marinigracilibium pacificum]NMM50186.1 RluA family pseudouridine synthase [Marinigracilibium pacificum]
MEQSKLTFEAAADGKIADLLKQEYPHMAVSQRKKWLSGDIYINQKQVRSAGQVVKKGDLIEFGQKKIVKSDVVKQMKLPFKVHYHDDTLMIIHKPAGLLTAMQKAKEGISCEEVINQAFAKNNIKKRVNVIHRLDREVEGLVAFAFNRKDREAVMEYWPSSDKRYLALVEGHIKNESGEIVTELVEGQRGTMKVSKNKKEEGKTAITSYRLLERFESHDLVELSLVTGRKNQLRVHMQYLGTPIVGDYKYGADDTYERQIRLLAYQLKIWHPKKSGWVSVNIEPPKWFTRLNPEDEKYKKNWTKFFKSGKAI